MQQRLLELHQGEQSLEQLFSEVDTKFQKLSLGPPEASAAGSAAGGADASPALPPPPPSGFLLDADAVKTLQDYGFDREQAEEALIAARGNIEQAVNILLGDGPPLYTGGRRTRRYKRRKRKRTRRRRKRVRKRRRTRVKRRRKHRTRGH